MTLRRLLALAMTLAMLLSVMAPTLALADEVLPNGDSAIDVPVDGDGDSGVLDLGDAGEPDLDVTGDLNLDLDDLIPGEVDTAAAAGAVEDEEQAVGEAENVPAAGEGEEETFTVTFNADGGEPEPEEQNVKSGETVQKPDDPKQDGKKFRCWQYWDEDDEDWYDYDFDEPVISDLHLKADWEDPYTVAFNAQGGTPAPSKQKVFWGDKVCKA